MNANSERPCDKCGHLPREHGRNRCLALLDDGEPCPCGRGVKR